MDVAAGVIAVIQLAELCLKLSRKWIGPSEFASTDLTAIKTALYEFNGAMRSFQLHRDIHEDDEARLASLEYLEPALGRCREALAIVKDFMENSSFIGKHLMGPKFDRKLKIALRALDGAKELFTLAVRSDQQIILLGVERYVRNIAEDLRDFRDGISTSLQQLHESGEDTYREVESLRKDQEESKYSKTRRIVLDWLTPIDYTSEQNDLIARRQDGTGEWLHEAEEYQTWLKTNGQTLFCPGIPGAGKTILTAITINDLNTRFMKDPDVAVAYIYCNFRRQGDQKAIDLLTSLLKQLSEAASSLPDSVKALYDQHKHKQTRPSFDEIFRTLQSVATTTYTRVFVVIDALDECRTFDGSRTKFLKELFKLQASSGANIFATSRFIPQITEFFEESSSLEIRASETDVRRYLDAHFVRLPNFVMNNQDLQEEIKTTIVESVQGMFLLAQLYLDSLIGKRSPKAVRAALAALPKGSEGRIYDHAYQNAMERIEGQLADQEQLAKQVLSWITCAKRPLNTTELQHALAIEVGEPDLDKDNLSQIEDILSVCAGLVTVDEESRIIRLVHYTTQEYFERMQEHWFPEAESELTTRCVAYLSFDSFGLGACKSDEEFETRLHLYPFYEYAAQNWGNHGYKSTSWQSILHLLEDVEKVQASGQALLVNRAVRYGRYSQRSPHQIAGIHLVAHFGIISLAETLIESGVDIESMDDGGRTPLSWAAAQGNVAFVQLLLDRGAEIESKDGNGDGQTPLSWAAGRGHEAVVQLLLDRGANIDSKDGTDETPLFWAAINGHEAVVQLLLIRGAEFELKDHVFGQTPLSWAAERGHEAVVQALLDRGAEVDSKSSDGRTPLSWAAENGHEAVAQLLLDRGANTKSKDDDGETPLLWAAETGQAAIVQLLLDRGAEIEWKDDRFGRTPLSWAVEDDRNEGVVRLLLDRGAEIESKAGNGQTPLSKAAENGHKALVQLLLDRGAEIESKDDNGRTPLSWAAENWDEAAAQLLIDRGAEIESKDGNGRTPLFWAAESGYDTVVHILQLYTSKS